MNKSVDFVQGFPLSSAQPFQQRISACWLKHRPWSQLLFLAWTQICCVTLIS